MERIGKPTSPCTKNCPYRDTYCKLDCPDYKDYEEKYKLYSDNRNKLRSKEEPLVQYRKDILNKQRRRNRRHG